MQPHRRGNSLRVCCAPEARISFFHFRINYTPEPGSVASHPPLSLPLPPPVPTRCIRRRAILPRVIPAAGIGGRIARQRGCEIAQVERGDGSMAKKSSIYDVKVAWHRRRRRGGDDIAESVASVTYERRARRSDKKRPGRRGRERKTPRGVRVHLHVADRGLRGHVRERKRERERERESEGRYFAVRAALAALRQKAGSIESRVRTHAHINWSTLYPSPSLSPCLSVSLSAGTRTCTQAPDRTSSSDRCLYTSTIIHTRERRDVGDSSICVCVYRVHACTRGNWVMGDLTRTIG